MQLNLEKERAAVSALEKKQRKFDQVCAPLYTLWCNNLLSQRLLNLQKQRVEGWGTERAGVKFLLLAKDKLKSVVFRIRKRNQISKSHFAEC